MSTEDNLRTALEAVIRATDSGWIYPENTGKGKGDQLPGLAFAGGEYAQILLDADDKPVSPEVLAIIQSVIDEVW